MSSLRLSKSPPRHHKAESLYEEHGEFVQRVIRKLVSDREQADDIYQELFLTLLTQPLYCPDEDVRPYLYRAVSNQVVDYSRRRQKYLDAVREYRREACGLGSYEAECPLEQADQRRQMLQILDFMENNLPPCESQAIINKYKHDRDLGQTARVMGVSRRTVIQYISNGFRRIRENIVLGGGNIDETI